MARKPISREELHEIVELIRTTNKTSKSPVWENKFWTEIYGKGKVLFFTFLVHLIMTIDVLKFNN
jgi:hypothetical protein